MKISQYASETFVNEDRTWLGSAHGTQNTRPITLDDSLFSAVTWPVDIYGLTVIPSGLPLGQVTASGLWAPYAGRTSEVQTVTIDATGGTFTLTVEGGTTAAIAWNASAATVQAAIEALNNVQPGDVIVTKSGLVYTITFAGKYSGENVNAITTGAGSLTGGGSTATVATNPQGGAAASDGTEHLKGHLYSSVRIQPGVSQAKTGAALFEHGRVRQAMLPANSVLDSAGKADVKGQIIYI